MMDITSNALIVMAKRPQPGQAKTRLVPPLTPEQAAGLYECFLLDTFALLRQITGIRCCTAYSPPGSEAYFSALAQDFELLAQAEGNLGQRLNAALNSYLQQGCQKVVLLGSDSPTLPVHFLEKAFSMLDAYPVVIGPSEDGGYYLIGARQPIPRLLLNVTMSTPTVMAETLRLAQESGLPAGRLPDWYDVDDAFSLARLITELEAQNSLVVAEWSRRWLVDNGWLSS